MPGDRKDPKKLNSNNVALDEEEGDDDPTDDYSKNDLLANAAVANADVDPFDGLTEGANFRTKM